MAKQEQFKILYALSFAWQLGFLIAAPLGILIVLGLWLDNTIHTAPLFILLGIFVGLATTFYEVYHMLAPLIHNDHKHD